MSSSNHIFNNKYEQIKLLGEGSFGKAYLVESLEDKSLAVIKTIELGPMDEKEKKEAILESKILEKLNHPNIIKFREVFLEKKNRLNIVMDYADGGDLQVKIKQHAKLSKYFNEIQILDWFTQTCLAIKHIHDRKILHRDIKSQNIFLTKNGLVKLGDFGIAKCLDLTMDKVKTIVGTPYYLSPELISNKPYSFKNDIWSLGVLLYEMCCLKMPFEAQNLPLLSLKICRGQFNPIPRIYSKEMSVLVSWCLNLDPNKRPTIKEILHCSLVSTRIKKFLNEVEFTDEFSHTIMHKINILKDPSKVEQSMNKDLVSGVNNIGNYGINKIHQRPIIKRDTESNKDNNLKNDKKKNEKIFIGKQGSYLNNNNYNRDYGNNNYNNNNNIVMNSNVVNVNVNANANNIITNSNNNANNFYNYDVRESQGHGNNSNNIANNINNIFSNNITNINNLNSYLNNNNNNVNSSNVNNNVNNSNNNNIYNNHRKISERKFDNLLNKEKKNSKYSTPSNNDHHVPSSNNYRGIIQTEYTSDSNNNISNLNKKKALEKNQKIDNIKKRLENNTNLLISHINNNKKENSVNNNKNNDNKIKRSVSRGSGAEEDKNNKIDVMFSRYLRENNVKNQKNLINNPEVISISNISGSNINNNNNKNIGISNNLESAFEDKLVSYINNTEFNDNKDAMEIKESYSKNNINNNYTKETESAIVSVRDSYQEFENQDKNQNQYNKNKLNKKDSKYSSQNNSNNNNSTHLSNNVPSSVASVANTEGNSNNKACFSNNIKNNQNLNSNRQANPQLNIQKQNYEYWDAINMCYLMKNLDKEDDIEEDEYFDKKNDYGNDNTDEGDFEENHPIREFDGMSKDLIELDKFEDNYDEWEVYKTNSNDFKNHLINELTEKIFNICYEFMLKVLNICSYNNQNNSNNKESSNENTDTKYFLAEVTEFDYDSLSAKLSELILSETDNKKLSNEIANYIPDLFSYILSEKSNNEIEKIDKKDSDGFLDLLNKKSNKSLCYDNNNHKKRGFKSSQNLDIGSELKNELDRDIVIEENIITSS